MATWTNPRTWASAILTAAQLNVDIRDNTNFLYGSPRCKLNNEFDTIPNNTLTACQFSSEEFDNDGMHSTSVNIDRLTFNTAGVYFILGMLEWAANTTGRREGVLMLNGATVMGNTKVGPSPTTGESMFQVSNIRAFAVGDYIQLHGFQNSGGNLTLLGLLAVQWMSG